ncbi:uncharacterized protein LOC117588409 [Drosophila guanche]|uniref:Uncharacterized protein n=1 Tax=Drosophila guanche TaxID=7266 RepID=A0A3B0KRP2_DROGU|nr:uncharacterized protein LOC117588409 [Drosophila guanche]SPP86588.1 Hypothetical predicted protein [Drosophila guanche]
MLEGVLIEIRPYLNCGQVYVKLNRNRANRMRIFVLEKRIYIDDADEGTGKSSNTEIMRVNEFDLDLGSLSGFLLSGKNMSFRFNFNQLTMSALDKRTVRVLMQPLLLTCRESDSLAIQCVGCQAEVAPLRIYRRMREFPNCIVDPNEFFCHGHGSMGCQDKPYSLLPGERDLFYGLNNVIIRMVNLSNIVQRGEHLHCQRCLRFLGMAIFNGAAARLWADTVRWVPFAQKAYEQQPASRHFFQFSTLTELVLRLLNSLWPHMLPSINLTGSRAVLFASPTSQQKQYMLIRVVEPQLRVLRRISGHAPELHGHYAIKLNYGIVEDCQAEPPAIVQRWQTHQDVSQFEISPQMFMKLRQRLDHNAEYQPIEWRHNVMSDNLILTYFIFEEEAQPGRVSVPPPKLLCNEEHSSDSDDEQSDPGSVNSTRERSLRLRRAISLPSVLDDKSNHKRLLKLHLHLANNKFGSSHDASLN